MNTPILHHRQPGYSRPHAAFVRPILYAWLAAGTLDILAAVLTSLLRGGAPINMLKAIASGLLGADAFRGGLDIAAFGLFMHYLIMLGIVAVYWLASRRLGLLRRHAIISGLLYGIVVYAVMNLVVLPLSAISFKPSYTLIPLATGIVVHMLCVGLPIAWIVRRPD